MAATGLTMKATHYNSGNSRGTTSCGRTLRDVVVPRHTADVERVTCKRCRRALLRRGRGLAAWVA